MKYYEYFKNAHAYGKTEKEAIERMGIIDDLPERTYENEKDAMKELDKAGPATIEYYRAGQCYIITYDAVIECEGEKNEDGTYTYTGTAINITTSELEAKTGTMTKLYYMRTNAYDMVVAIDELDECRYLTENIYYPQISSRMGRKKMKEAAEKFLERIEDTSSWDDDINKDEIFDNVKIWSGDVDRDIEIIAEIEKEI